MTTRHPVVQPWIWEFGTRDGKTVYDTTEFWNLPDLKAAVDASFADYVYEEVERRGIRGTAVLVNLGGYGRYQDTGHWVYRAESPVKRRRKALTVLLEPGELEALSALLETLGASVVRTWNGKGVTGSVGLERPAHSTLLAAVNRYRAGCPEHLRESVFCKCGWYQAGNALLARPKGAF